MYHVVQVDEGVIDGHNLHLLGGESSTGHQATNASKSKKKGTVWFVSAASRWCCETIKSLTSHWKPIHICFSGLQWNMGKNAHNVLTDLRRNTTYGSLLLYSTFLPPPLCEMHFDSGHLKSQLNKRAKFRRRGRGGRAHSNPPHLGGLKSNSRCSVVILVTTVQRFIKWPSYSLTTSPTSWHRHTVCSDARGGDIDNRSRTLIRKPSRHCVKVWVM